MMQWNKTTRTLNSTQKAHFNEYLFLLLHTLSGIMNKGLIAVLYVNEKSDSLEVITELKKLMESDDLEFNSTPLANNSAGVLVFGPSGAIPEIQKRINDFKHDGFALIYQGLGGYPDMPDFIGSLLEDRKLLEGYENGSDLLFALRAPRAWKDIEDFELNILSIMDENEIERSDVYERFKAGGMEPENAERYNELKEKAVDAKA